MRAKVSDYGITRQGPSSAAKTSTRTNIIIGTTVYMAPEYITSGRVSDKIDAYSYGVVSSPRRHSLTCNTVVTQCHSSLHDTGASGLGAP